MKRQALVIGLGRFGLALARSLTGEGYEVIGVDVDRARVERAADFAARAACLDATDEEALQGLAPDDRDLAVCAIGDESREAAILVTTLLRQLGAPRIVARATDPLVARVLRLVGAHEVVDPEVEFAERYARRLAYRGILDEIELGPALEISEVKVRPAMVGRSLAELDLRGRFGLNVLAIKEGPTADALEPPDPTTPLAAEASLIVVGRPGAARKMHEAW